MNSHSVIGNARRRFNVIGLHRLVHVKQLTSRVARVTLCWVPEVHARILFESVFDSKHSSE